MAFFGKFSDTKNQLNHRCPPNMHKKKIAAIGSFNSGNSAIQSRKRINNIPGFARLQQVVLATNVLYKYLGLASAYGNL